MTRPTARFQVLREPFGAESGFRLTDTRTGEYALVLPFAGGAINRLALRSGNKLVEILDGYASTRDMQKTLATSFKGCSLFPFPNRVSGGTYSFDSKRYQLIKNFPQEDNAIHGLVFDKTFELVQHRHGEQECHLKLGYSPLCCDPGYPFSYRLDYEYRLSADEGFSCTTGITNKSDTAIPVGLGWHPYFSLEASSINELLLHFPAKELIEVDSRKIPTGRSRDGDDFGQPKLLGSTVLDSCFRLDCSGKQAEIRLSNRQNKMSLVIWMETGAEKYNFLQLYTPPARRSIAIEPMSCAPDAFNSGDGLIRLLPGRSIVMAWGVSPPR